MRKTSLEIFILDMLIMREVTKADYVQAKNNTQREIAIDRLEWLEKSLEKYRRKLRKE